MRNHITLTIEELTGKRRELDLLIESLTAYGRETATETPPAPAHERITTKDTKRKPKKPRSQSVPDTVPRKSGGGQTMVARCRAWCAGHPRGITAAILAAGVGGLTRKAASDRLVQLKQQGTLRPTIRGVFEWIGDGNPQLGCSMPDPGPMGAAGSFTLPTGRPSALLQAVVSALPALRDPWTRDELEEVLPAPMLNLGRKDGNLAATLTHLRERGTIELLGREDGVSRYRTGRPKEHAAD